MEALFGYFLPGECYHKVFENFEFFDENCFKIALSRSLSFGVILGAVGVKIPQIIKILRSLTTDGLSYTAYLLELGAVTAALAYNFNKGFPFSTWGENLFIAIQVLIILVLMCILRSHIIQLGIFALLYTATVWYLTVSGLAPPTLTAGLQGLVIPLILGSRLVTITTIYKGGSTGQLSFLTSFLNFIGTLARVFTTMQETGDPLLLASFLFSVTLNTIIVLQFMWYWNAPTATIIGTGSSGKSSYKKD